MKLSTRTVLQLATTIALCLSTMACSRQTVEPGHEIVFNMKPYFFGSGGLSKDPLKHGSTYRAWSTSDIDVDTRPRTFDETFDDIMPKDNNPVDYHAAVRLKIMDSVRIVEKFGTEEAGGLPMWYVNNVQRHFQNANRNQVRQYSMPQLALEQAVVVDVENALETDLRTHFAKIGLPVEVQEVTLGRISPQKEIIWEYNQTGVQQQRSKTEVQKKLAEDARKASETSRAVADKAYQDGLGMNTDQYIRLQQIKMCGDKGSGCTLILNGGATPMVNVK